MKKNTIILIAVLLAGCSEVNRMTMGSATGRDLEALWEKHAHRTKIYPKPGGSKKKN